MSPERLAHIRELLAEHFGRGGMVEWLAQPKEDGALALRATAGEYVAETEIPAGDIGSLAAYALLVEHEVGEAVIAKGWPR